jgi:REP element-mobilizing transposase RayT
MFVLLVCQSSKGLQRPDLIRRYWKGILRSPSYFAAFRGGTPINILKTYIEPLSSKRLRCDVAKSRPNCVILRTVN